MTAKYMLSVHRVPTTFLYFTRNAHVQVVPRAPLLQLSSEPSMNALLFSLQCSHLPTKKSSVCTDLLPASQTVLVHLDNRMSYYR